MWIKSIEGTCLKICIVTVVWRLKALERQQSRQSSSAKKSRKPKHLTTASYSTKYSRLIAEEKPEQCCDRWKSKSLTNRCKWGFENSWIWETKFCYFSLSDTKTRRLPLIRNLSCLLPEKDRVFTFGNSEIRCVTDQKWQGSPWKVATISLKIEIVWKQQVTTLEINSLDIVLSNDNSRLPATIIINHWWKFSAKLVYDQISLLNLCWIGITFPFCMKRCKTTTKKQHSPHDPTKLVNVDFRARKIIMDQILSNFQEDGSPGWHSVLHWWAKHRD